MRDAVLAALAVAMMVVFLVTAQAVAQDTEAYTGDDMLSAYEMGYRQALKDVHDLCVTEGAFILGGDTEEREFTCIRRDGGSTL